MSPGSPFAGGRSPSKDSTDTTDTASTACTLSSEDEALEPKQTPKTSLVFVPPQQHTNREPKNGSRMTRWYELTQWLRPKAPYRFKLVDEIPQLPTVVLDLDATVIHTLVDPSDIAAAQQSDLRTIKLPSKMGLVVERPGLQQLFASLRGYNVVVYSAGGSCYVKTLVERLVEGNPFMQGKICKVLSQPDLVRYSLLSELPCDTSLKSSLLSEELPFLRYSLLSELPCFTEGVYYVKDLRKAREDGNTQKVLIVDDNENAYQIHPDMRDADFKKRYDFTMNALPVSEFIATDPKAVFDTAFVRVERVLAEIAGMDDAVAALAGSTYWKEEASI